MAAVLGEQMVWAILGLVGWNLVIAGEPGVDPRVGSQAGCESMAVRRLRGAEIPYNGVDDDCNPTTYDDDLDGDGLTRFQDCNDLVAGDIRVLRESLRWMGDDNPCAAGGTLRIEGDLTIGHAVQSVADLACICAISGKVEVAQTKSLETLEGLGGLKFVGGDFKISQTQGLLDINALSSLEAVGGSLSITDNQSLSSVNGLDSLIEVGGDLTVASNAIMVGIDGLNSLEAVTGSLVVNNNRQLASVNGMDSLQAVGGDLELSENKVLAAVDGVGSLVTVGGELGVFDNPKLSLFNALKSVVAVGDGVAMTGNAAVDEEETRERLEKQTGGPQAKELLQQQQQRFGRGEAKAMAMPWLDRLLSAEYALVIAVGLVVLAFCVLILFIFVPGLEKMFREPEAEEPPPPPPGHSIYLHSDEGDREKRELPASLDRIPEPELKEAEQYLEPVWAAYGDVLIQQDDDDGAVAWVIDGELAVGVNGVEVGRVFPEELVGEMCLFEEGGRGAEVKAVMPSRLLVIERTGYEALARAGNQVAKVLEQVAVHGTGRKLRATERRLAGESIMSSRARMRDADAQGVAIRLAEFASALRPLPADPHAQGAVEVLSQTPVFGHMGQSFLQYLAEKMSLREYGPGQPLTVQGDAGQEMFVLAAGRVDLLLATADKAQLVLLDDLHPGDVFGLTSLFSGSARAASAVALGPVTALVLDARLANALMDTDKPIGRAFRIAMVRALMGSLREANAHLSGHPAGASQSENIHRARAVILAHRRDRK